MPWLLVALGGALGAMARFAITTHLYPVAGNRFPVGTLVANVVGAAMIAVFYVVIVEKALLPPAWRHLAMTGFLGALTTFSTFSLDAFILWQNGLHLMAGVYVLANLFLCFAAVAGVWYLLNFVLS